MALELEESMNFEGSEKNSVKISEILKRSFTQPFSVELGIAIYTRKAYCVGLNYSWALYMPIFFIVQNHRWLHKLMPF